MHHYHSLAAVHHFAHPSLRHHTLRCMDPLYECLMSMCWPIGQRFVVALMTMLGISSLYMQRMCLSIMMTQMVSVAKEKIEGSSCPSMSSGKVIAKGTLDWSVGVQGEILAAFFYGYILTHIPGGIISDLWGGKHIFGLSVLLTSICSALTPFCAKIQPYALFGLRVVMGLAQGPLFPAVTSLVAHWAPPEERALLNTLTNSGVPVGLVLGNFVSGYLLQYWPPWDHVFYCFAVMGGVWFIFWFILVAPSPANHPFMKEQERDYILDSIHKQSLEPTGKIPWGAMLADKNFWFICIANLGHEWLLFFVATELPIYLAKVQRLPIEMNGIASAIPWISMWIGTLIFGEIATQLEGKKLLPKSLLRRFFSLTANVLPGGILVVTLFVGCNYWLVVAVMSTALFFIASIFISIRCSCLDITPNFAGIAMSVVSGIAGLAGFGIPLFVHNVIGDGTKVSDWTLPLYVTGGIAAVSTIPYFLFITVEVLPWDAGKPKTTSGSQ